MYFCDEISNTSGDVIGPISYIVRPSQQESLDTKLFLYKKHPIEPQPQRGKKFRFISEKLCDTVQRKWLPYS